MWFECSECGGHVPSAAAPIVCPACGLAGATFTPADAGHLAGDDSDGDGLRASWFRAGLEQAELVDRV